MTQLALAVSCVMLYSWRAVIVAKRCLFHRSVGSLLAYYFKERFNASASFLGALLFVSNMIAGASSLSSG